MAFGKCSDAPPAQIFDHTRPPGLWGEQKTSHLFIAGHCASEAFASQCVLAAFQRHFAFYKLPTAARSTAQMHGRWA